MSEKNYLNETVVPRMPKSVSNEQLFVFVPVASGAVAGILKINDTDFYKNRLPELKIIESGTLDSTNKPYYNPLGYVRAGIIKAYVDAADEALQDSIDLKQDINLSKSIAEATTVEGALINLDSSTKDLKTRMTKAEGDINTLKNADEGLANRINNLEQSAYVGETPIGTYPSGATLPTQAQLTAFVQQEVNRAPKLGDVVLFTQIVADGTDKSYKFMYTETGWSNYVVSILEKLSNTPGTSDTDGYTQKAVNGIVQNPNLLINPNFAINQRGQTSYTGPGYTVDRWTLVGSGATVTPTSKGIRLTSTDSWQGLNQYIEDYKQLDGQTVTLSIKIASSSDLKTFVFGLRDNDGAIVEKYSAPTETAGIYTVTTTIPSKESRTQLRIFLWSRYANQVFNIEWAKLEIGSVATEFSPPNIAEELPKCQRYYQNCRLHGCSVTASTTTSYYPSVPIPVSMRVKPTITVTQKPNIRGYGINYAMVDADSIDVYLINDNMVTLAIVLSTAKLTASQVYSLANGQATFDAEI